VNTFTGKPYDADTGLYYFPYRYYAPDAARWLTRDPLGMVDGPNSYQYIVDDPLNSWDPLGLSAVPTPPENPTPESCKIAGRDARCRELPQPDRKECEDEVAKTCKKPRNWHICCHSDHVWCKTCNTAKPGSRKDECCQKKCEDRYKACMATGLKTIPPKDCRPN